MALSPAMVTWVIDRIAEAEAILASPRSTPSQKAVARYTLQTWGYRHG
jgi:hypothetical protein